VSSIWQAIILLRDHPLALYATGLYLAGLSYLVLRTTIVAHRVLSARRSRQQSEVNLLRALSLIAGSSHDEPPVQVSQSLESSLRRATSKLIAVKRGADRLTGLFVAMGSGLAVLATLFAVAMIFPAIVNTASKAQGLGLHETIPVISIFTSIVGVAVSGPFFKRVAEGIVQRWASRRKHLDKDIE
jgi:hypothetical protein